MTQLSGATVFITGGAQGIGLSMARAFAREGATLALADVDQEALAAAESELAEVTTVAAVTLDVRDREAYARVADEVERRLGPVSVLCNNAGVGGAWTIGEMDYRMWDWTIGVNLSGTINGVQTFLPRMLAREAPGHVVNTASAAGLAPTGAYMYGPAKAAVIALSEELRQLPPLASHPIGVTVLCPGPVATKVVDNIGEQEPQLDLSEELRAAKERWRELESRFLDEVGMDPDQVGTMVVEAVTQDRLYVHTDRLMVEPIRARLNALIDAMPHESDHDRRLQAAVQRIEQEQGATAS